MIESSTKYSRGERMTRDELKDLVKECLLEIIVEGSPQRVVESLSERKTQRQSQRPAVSRPALDLIHPRGKVPQAKPSMPPRAAPPRPAPSDFKSLANGNDIMASVFADTAASGLVERLGSPDGSSMVESSNPVIDTGVDPTLFEGASNWATMAFADSRNSSRR